MKTEANNVAGDLHLYPWEDQLITTSQVKPGKREVKPLEFPCDRRTAPPSYPIRCEFLTRLAAESLPGLLVTAGGFAFAMATGKKGDHDASRPKGWSGQAEVLRN